ncbi:mechanosensitive ion channel domain-containing protein [Haloferula rosea]|uniref:Mechanosensitive ion channel n=1 Tax=Haloferula rosea TaxID=490093 RepID=A0A934VF87_9BACT|nr:mechanosensitive ion channel domain-containing protein [Haloferula rosea]MBK1828109.1 mechanosensitive ion channel [Haloferula rosea]
MSTTFQAGASRWLVTLVITVGWLTAAERQESALDPARELRSEVADLRVSLEASDLDDAGKESVKQVLDTASNRIDAAVQSKQQMEGLGKSSPRGAAELEGLKRELADLPTIESQELEIPEDIDSLRGRLEAERAAVAQASTELGDAQSMLTDLRELPVRVANRLPEAKAEFSQKKAKLALLGEPADESLAAMADRVLVEAEIEALESEIALLERQQVGIATREQVAAARLELVSRRLKLREAAVAVYEGELNRRLENEVARMRDEVRELVREAGDEGIKRLAADLNPLVEQLGSTTDRIENTRSRLDETQQRLDHLKKESERLRRQVELGGKDGAFSQVLLDRRRRLEDGRGLNFDLRTLDEELSDAQLEGYRLEDLSEDLDQLREEWADVPEAMRVLEIRGILLGRLQDNQSALLRDLARLSTDKRAYRDLTQEFSSFLSEQLFLSRSSPPIGTKFFQQLPGSIAWTFSSENWVQLARGLAAIPGRHPFVTSLLVLVVGALLGLRRRLRESIANSGKRIRRISTDRLVHTLRGLLDTLLLAAPLPLVLAFLAWGLSSQPRVDTWVRGFGSWLGWTAWALMWIFSLREMAREEGVGQRHFGWNAGSSERLRHSLGIIAVFYLPILLLTGLTVFESNPGYFDSLGRLSFIVAECVMAWAFWRMFHPSAGVFADIIRERPDRMLSKWRYLWIGLAAGLPIGLAVMAALGYGLTALILSELFHASMRWIGIGVVVYGVLLRWLMIRARRIGLQEAIARRNARRESLEEGEDPDETSTGETVAADDAQVEMDIKSVAQQMRRLLRSLIGVGVLLAMVYTGASMLPLEEVARSEVANFSWLGLIQAVLIGAVSLTVIRNLPGMVDLAGMRASGVAPGVRYAVATLCQYAVGALAILLASHALAVDWSKFGWIAAALSVGLGFGLQEIVANFVCGIIVLFERPIRVGDVVTVGEVTGTVSRIRMRATTITNWERQEFVVPNKDFITGSLINWTLSSPLNRVTLNVGVAYGTDTAEARRILTEIAEAHPTVLDDPAPLINFERFGDSTLDLSMRCYLPNMENRLRTQTELNEEIDRRFGEAGIEISFPQRDLHIRSMPNTEALDPLAGQS